MGGKNDSVNSVNSVKKIDQLYDIFGKKTAACLTTFHMCQDIVPQTSTVTSILSPLKKDILMCLSKAFFFCYYWNLDTTFLY